MKKRQNDTDENHKWHFNGNLVNEWNQVFGGFNWYNFTLVTLGLEISKWIPYASFSFIVLGLGFHMTVAWPHEKTDTEKTLDERIEDIEKRSSIN